MDSVTFVPRRGWRKRYAANAAKRQKKAQRKGRLSVPITKEQIATFAKCLVAVSFGADSECWLYVGRKGVTVDGPAFRSDRYATIAYNGERIGAHVFAYCAANGITPAELAGFDIHHATSSGRCIGYRCCNPDHLEARESPPHRGTRGNPGSLARFQTDLVSDVLEVPEGARRPAEQLTLTGAGSRRRFLGGYPFLIKGGILTDLIPPGTSPADAST